MSKYSCPANNADMKRVPDFIQPAGVMCKPCSHQATVTDLSTEQGEFWVGLEWGPLIDTKGAMQEDNVAAYQVHIVDSKGRILTTVDTVDKTESPATCCTKGLYSTTVTGKLPVGYDKFMITPVTGFKKIANKSDVAMNLPMGFLTDPIIDVEQGLSTKVVGSFELVLSKSVADLKANVKEYRKVKAAFRGAIADAIEGVIKDWVLIKDITQKKNSTAVRRLREETSVARRLAGGKVVVDYEIIIPETASVGEITAASINPDVLKKSINTRVKAAGVSGVEVSGKITVNAPVAKPVGTPMAQTGGARRHAPLAAFVGSIVLAMVGMLN